MKKITRNIFFISLIGSLLVAFLVISTTDMITIFGPQKANSYVHPEAYYDMYSQPHYVGGYRILFNNSLSILEIITISSILALFTFTSILHLISWLLHLKKDTKTNIIASIVLASISSFIRIFLDMLLALLLFFSPFSMLAIIIFMIEVSCTLGILLYYITKHKKISALYSNLKT